MNMNFDAVFYEPAALSYELGKRLREKYSGLPWMEIKSHNRIPELGEQDNTDFPRLKQHLIVGIRKTHKYVPNSKVSDWLVPYTSSGCRAMCLYCYLVCNYNKYAYLRLFVNREEMMDRLLKADAAAPKPETFEIGSNSDLVLENTVTDNLPWTIERFAQKGKGRLTFPTKFDMVQPLLNLNHGGKTIFRMSVNPPEIIRGIEIGTSGLNERLAALNAVCEAGYPTGLLIAPVILVEGWKEMYERLFVTLEERLSEKVRTTGFIEMILMTYSYVQNAINEEAFPNAMNPFDPALMTGRGRGKYCYRAPQRAEAEAFLREMAKRHLGSMPILYIS